MAKIERMAGTGRHLPEILQLRPAIAIAEGVNVVDVAHDRACRYGESRSVQPSQKIGLHKPAVDVGHAGRDVLAELKLVAALGNLHGPQLTGPRIEVLKKMAVDRPKMREIEGAYG